jgi:hypothetical protein
MRRGIVRPGPSRPAAPFDRSDVQHQGIFRRAGAMALAGALIATLGAGGCDDDARAVPVDAASLDAATVDMPGDMPGATDVLTAPDAPGGVARPGLVFQIVDDIERDDPGFVCPIGLCSWFHAAATLAAPVPARGRSERAWHLSSAGGGAGLDTKLDVHGPAFPAVPYPDLRAYAGVAFWARSDRDETLTVAVEDDQVLATSYQAALAAGRPWFTSEVRLSRQWRRHIVLFDDLRQLAMDGTPVPGARLHTAAIWSFHFIAALRGPSDAWIDELSLLCKGECPAPAYAPVPATSAAALDDASFSWMPSSSSDPALTCAEIAELTLLPPDAWRAGPGEKVFLRARVAGVPDARVPLWGWTVERLPAGTPVPVTVIDEASTMIAVPVTEPGGYRVRAHTHFPGNATCGVEIVGTAVR